MKRYAQKGVALISAILVVALAAVLIAVMFDQSEINLARTRNVLREAQALELSQGLEVWAIELLRRDAGENAHFDSRNESWNNALPPTPVPGGVLAGRMRDLHGCFNINSIVKNGQVVPLQLTRFQRLLVVLKLDQAIAMSVADWLDADNEPRLRGAEDLHYLALQPPYRVANNRLWHVSEMRLIRGVDDKAYAALRPHICALPAETTINVNTATAIVLMALDDAITEKVAEKLYTRAAAGFTDITYFQQALGELNIVEFDVTGLSVGSSYFELRSDVMLDQIPMRFFSTIERRSGDLRVIARRREE